MWAQRTDWCGVFGGVPVDGADELSGHALDFDGLFARSDGGRASFEIF